MSELKLSDQLIESIQNTLIQNDDRASDTGITVQYLAAILGYMLGNQNFSKDEKHEFLEQLFAFSQHVLDDVSQDKNQPPPPPTQEAFGIWKPDNKS